MTKIYHDSPILGGGGRRNSPGPLNVTGTAQAGENTGLACKIPNCHRTAAPAPQLLDLLGMMET